MKHLELIEAKLIAARRKDESGSMFVDQVMDTVKAHAINSRAFRTTNEQLKKETFIMKLRKLPTALLVIIVFAAVVSLGGISYAAVKVIEATQSATIKESHVNQSGKTQITLAKDACQDLKETHSEHYELKEGVNLPKEDAAKYINAHCHLFAIDERLNLHGTVFANGMARGTVASIRDNTVSLKIDDTLYGPLDNSGDFYNGDIQQINLTDFKVGDEVLAYRDMFTAGANKPIIAIFKPIEALKYYDPSQQQNIRAVKPCLNNETMDCVVASNYNAVTLIAARGGLNIPQSQDTKEMQGRLIEHDDSHFILENNGHRITFQTPYDVVTRFNQTTVYGLAGYDTIYANTDPKLLKIAVGDSLSLYYSTGTNDTTIPWSQSGIIMLMVEREPNNISVLRKY